MGHTTKVLTQLSRCCYLATVPYFVTMSEAAWREAFNQFDTDGSGVISARELVNCLESLLGDHDKAVSVGADILADADTDKSKSITWEEFKTAMEKSGC